MSKLKVVVHMNQSERFNHGCENIFNLLKSGKDCDVCVVLTGECAISATNDTKIKDLIDNGVTVNVCQNSLNHFDIKKENLLEGMNVVPAGIVEIIEKQAEGYGYIKP